MHNRAVGRHKSLMLFIFLIIFYNIVCNCHLLLYFLNTVFNPSFHLKNNSYIYPNGLQPMLRPFLLPKTLILPAPARLRLPRIHVKSHPEIIKELFHLRLEQAHDCRRALRPSLPQPEPALASRHVLILPQLPGMLRG